jgi:Holliday junction DNA helicase RuvB
MNMGFPEALNPLVSPHPQPGDLGSRVSLRPKNLQEYIGQESVVQKLGLMLKAAKQRMEPLEHLLLHGPPGLGKTSLAHVIAHEMQTRIVVTSGPTLERSGDLAALLTHLNEGEVLFIDEVHRLPKVVEETLYPAMEDFKLDLIIGQGPMARTTQLRLQRFTLIGATTRAGLMSAPLRDRFGAAFRLDFYPPEVLQIIVTQTAQRLEMTLLPEAALEVARRSRGTPRIANRLIRRVRDFSEVQQVKGVDVSTAREALNLFEIDDVGCDPMDRKILQLMIHRYRGGPVGIETLASSLSEDVGTLEDFYEPYLIQLGFIQRTPRGRMATHLAYTYLGLEPPPPPATATFQAGLFE